MKLLLDTHCLIWLLTEASQLTPALRGQIDDADSVWFSDASIWELGLKWRKGKISVKPRSIAGQAVSNGLRPLAIQQEAILVSSELRTKHGDPFDRLLYAQAKVAGCQLLTIDRKLSELGAKVMRPR